MTYKNETKSFSLYFRHSFLSVPEAPICDMNHKTSFCFLVVFLFSVMEETLQGQMTKAQGTAVLNRESWSSMLVKCFWPDLKLLWVELPVSIRYSISKFIIHLTQKPGILIWHDFLQLCLFISHSWSSLFFCMFVCQIEIQVSVSWCC